MLDSSVVGGNVLVSSVVGVNKTIDWIRLDGGARVRRGRGEGE